MMRLALNAAVLILLAAPVQAQDHVRLVAADGSELAGVLESADGTGLVVSVDGASRRIERAGLRSVVFVPPAPAPPPNGLEVTPRCEWRLVAPLERVLGELARRAGREIEAEAHLHGEVRVFVQNGTWRDALRAAARDLRAGVEISSARVCVLTTVRAPFHLVVARDLPAPEPLVPMPWQEPSGDMNALRWLVRVQEPDGRWSARAPGAEPEGGDTAATALAILAYLGNGHTHRFGTHKRTIKAALDWLRSDADQGRPSSPAPNLDCALRVHALAEAYAVSRDFTLRPRAEAALQELLRRRTSGSGWGLGAGDPPDAFSTAHAVLALKACLTAGLTVEGAAFDDAGAFLVDATDERGLVGFRAPGEGVSLTLDDPDAALPLPLFTAGAVIARIFTGERRYTETLRLGRDLLMAARPHARRHDPAYWYLATYSQFQMGGADWKVWVKDLQSALFTLQREEPPELVGSWDPAGLWGQLGGRVATTALASLSLEIYYRYERAQKH